MSENIGQNHGELLQGKEQIQSHLNFSLSTSASPYPHKCLDFDPDSSRQSRIWRLPDCNDVPHRSKCLFLKYWAQFQVGHCVEQSRRWQGTRPSMFIGSAKLWAGLQCLLGSLWPLTWTSLAFTLISDLPLNSPLPLYFLSSFTIFH